MNLVVKDKRGNVIHFLRDAERSGNNYRGTNGRLFGLKPDAHVFVWTEDEMGASETVKRLKRGRSIVVRSFTGRPVKESPEPLSKTAMLKDRIGKAKSVEEIKSLLIDIVGRL